MNRTGMAFGVLLMMSTACSSSSTPSENGMDASSCASGQTACGALCCTSTALCLTDSLGNKSCAQSCETSSDCANAANPCCTPMGNRGACIAAPTSPKQLCMCQKASECNTGCCAPQTDSNGNPLAPFVCKLVDGKPYDCCDTTSVPCSSGSCCVAITDNGSSVCEEPCHNDTQCGFSSCVMFTTGTCAGLPGGCQP